MINEAVELAKTFGGTDGHKFVNGVLDKLAPQVRAAEFAGAAKDDLNVPQSADFQTQRS